MLEDNWCWERERRAKRESVIDRSSESERETQTKSEEEREEKKGRQRESRSVLEDNRALLGRHLHHPLGRLFSNWPTGWRYTSVNFGAEPSQHIPKPS
jgi:hypothetical protein